jgi:hypothetical protein
MRPAMRRAAVCGRPEMRERPQLLRRLQCAAVAAAERAARVFPFRVGINNVGPRKGRWSADVHSGSAVCE